MKLNAKDLTTERLWRSATGMDAQRFYVLLDAFKSAYIRIHHRPLAERKVETGIDYCITNEEELLLFVLFSLKSGLNYDLLGVVCGLSASNAKRNQAIGVDILQKTLAELGCLPKRNFLNVEEFVAFFKDHETLIIDATEQRIQRPGDAESQKDCYSGKKKPIP